MHVSFRVPPPRNQTGLKIETISLKINNNFQLYVIGSVYTFQKFSLLCKGLIITLLGPYFERSADGNINSTHYQGGSWGKPALEGSLSWVYNLCLLCDRPDLGEGTQPNFSLSETSKVLLLFQVFPQSQGETVVASSQSHSQRRPPETRSTRLRNPSKQSQFTNRVLGSHITVCQLHYTSVPLWNRLGRL